MADEWMSDNARNRAHATADQFATGSMQFLVIDAKAVKPLNVQANLDLLVQVISTRSQPLILGAPEGNVINVAFGHAEVWSDKNTSGNTATFTDLVAALVAAGFTGATVTAKAF